jgi:hypothetical protein
MYRSVASAGPGWVDGWKYLGLLFARHRFLSGPGYLGVGLTGHGFLGLTGARIPGLTGHRLVWFWLTHGYLLVPW